MAWKNRRDPVAKWFAATLATVVVWAAGYAVELLATELEDKIFFANLQFIGVSAISVCWWEMIRRYVGLFRVRGAITVAIWAIPVATVPIAFLNPWHLFRGNPSLEIGVAPFALLHADYGPWYWWILMPFTFLVNMATLTMLVRGIARGDRLCRLQHGLLTLAFLLPLIGNLLYVFDVVGWSDYNPAVGLLSISCLLMALGLFRYGLFSIVSMAREKVIEELADAVIVVDRRGRLVDLNRAAERLLAVERGECLARPAEEGLKVHPALLDAIVEPTAAARAAVPLRRDITIDLPEGPSHHALTCAPVTTRRGEYLGRALILHDISERVKLLERTREMAERDDLTGLCNRRHFLDLTARELERAQRYRLPLSFLLLDVDHFKKVNDTMGHQAGDELLRELADLFRANLRSSDIAGRVGGEEFAVVLPETDLDSAAEVAGRLRETVESLRLRLDTLGDPTLVTVSMGLAEFNHQSRGRPDDFRTLYERADRALYEAKASGRNMVVASKEESGLRAVG